MNNQYLQQQEMLDNNFKKLFDLFSSKQISVEEFNSIKNELLKLGNPSDTLLGANPNWKDILGQYNLGTPTIGNGIMPYNDWSKNLGTAMPKINNPIPVTDMAYDMWNKQKTNNDLGTVMPPVPLDKIPDNNYYWGGSKYFNEQTGKYEEPLPRELLNPQNITPPNADDWKPRPLTDNLREGGLTPINKNKSYLQWLK